MHRRLAHPLFALLALAPLGAACTKHVTIDPRNVKELAVRPYQGEAEFCPGHAFQIELVAKMSDGTTCSNLDKRSGCLGHSKAIIDPNDVRLTATNATALERPEYGWLPDPNPLATAATGMQLGGWIETKIDDKPMKTDFARAALKPVYSCMRETNIEPDLEIGYGQDGARGPDLEVYATALATPYYPDAVLVRIEAPAMNLVRYVISPSSNSPVAIASKGQGGGRGHPGARGADGAPGVSSSSVCGTGGPGGAGGNGGPGGQGGNGGPGGFVRLHLDGAMAPMLRERVLVASLGGAAGPGGQGGAGGNGGPGGAGGPSGDSCTGSRGPQGSSGIAGPYGRDGYPGPNGPPPKFFLAPRDAMFASEAARMAEIEAAGDHPVRRRAADDSRNDRATETKPTTKGKQKGAH